jgi:sortase A
MQRRTKRQLERFFLLTGIGCLVIFLASIAGPAVYQDWGNWAFDRKLRNEPVTLGAYLTAKRDPLIGNAPPQPPHAPPPLNSPKAMPRQPFSPPLLKTGTLVGRLEIPRLHLTSMVREGAGESTLAISLGHIPGTSLPGQSGNVGVAGHRDKLFRELRNIQSNDVVKFETLSGTYTYRVEGINIVTPQDVGVLKASDHPQLTLVTCYPFYYVGPAPKRYIVKARQISGALPEPSPQLVTKAIPAKPASKPAPTRSPGKTIFSVSAHHSLQLAPGVSIGLTGTDVPEGRLRGWVWLASGRRTIWLHDRTPLRIYGALDGRTRLLVITGITRGSITGYVVAPRS